MQHKKRFIIQNTSTENMHNLDRYIKEMSERGLSADEIRKKLHGSNYIHEDIESSLLRVTNQNSPSSSPPNHHTANSSVSKTNKKQNWIAPILISLFIIVIVSTFIFRIADGPKSNIDPKFQGVDITTKESSMLLEESCKDFECSWEKLFWRYNTIYNRTTWSNLDSTEQDRLSENIETYAIKLKFQEVSVLTDLDVYFFLVMEKFNYSKEIINDLYQKFLINSSTKGFVESSNRLSLLLFLEGLSGTRNTFENLVLEIRFEDLKSTICAPSKDWMEEIDSQDYVMSYKYLEVIGICTNNNFDSTHKKFYKEVIKNPKESPRKDLMIKDFGKYFT